MHIKRTISKITSVAILSMTIISFIPVSSYAVTYYSSNSYNSSNTNYSRSYYSSNNSITRYYSRNNNTATNQESSIESNTKTSDSQNTINPPSYTVSSNNSVTRYYSRNTESNNTANSSNTESNIPSNTTTSIDNINSSSIVNDNVSFEADELTKKMLTLINDERRKNGLKELILDESLTSVAELKAKDMVENNYLSHTSPTYGSIYTMIKDAGIKYYNAGENIAKAFSVDSAHNNFMNSYMHKKAILADHFTHVGIGIEKENGGMYKISVMFIEAK